MPENVSVNSGLGEVKYFSFMPVKVYIIKHQSLGLKITV